MTTPYRVTIDLAPAHEKMLDELVERKDRSKVDIMRAALGFLHWYEQAKKEGWIIKKCHGSEQTRDYVETALELLY
jgi:hypothetical protein